MDYILVFILGVFCIPTIKEVKFNLRFKKWTEHIFCLDFLKEVISRTFNGGY